MPTWGWYVVGAVVFIAIYLYISSSKTKVGQTVAVPQTDALVIYNQDANILSQILAMQQPNVNHMATGK